MFGKHFFFLPRKRQEITQTSTSWPKRRREAAETKSQVWLGGKKNEEVLIIMYLNGVICI